MYCIKKITEDLCWVGGNDRRLALFENVFPIPRGVSYNAYLLTDEKTVLFDTVDRAVGHQMLENLDHALAGRTLDYLVVNHMEPDHCATIGDLMRRFPDVTIVCNAKTRAMLGQFFRFEREPAIHLVAEGDTLCVGRHTLTFAMAPMVHWPEVMVTFDLTDGTLFSADAFGTFGALGGSLFADEVNFETEWLPDARRYYANIVGKYGPQVTALLKKAASLQIRRICPLHGPVWRRNIGWYLEKYERWGAYRPEEDAVMIAYGSIYGGTENAAEVLAEKLAQRGVRNVALYDVSATHPSVIVAEAFRCSHLVFASATYNAGIFCNMETVLHDLKAHNLQNRTVALIENGSWAPSAGSLMRELFESMKGITLLPETVSVRSTLQDGDLPQLDAMAEAIAASVASAADKGSPDPMTRIPYGLFLLTARDGERDNGCIVNTVTQVTDAPQRRISVAVNKSGLTHDMILKTGLLAVSILTEDAPFSVFERFGLKSGRDGDKFDGFAGTARTQSGLLRLDRDSNAYCCARVVAAQDCGTHTIFIAEVIEAQALSDAPSVTYGYYLGHIRPKPAPAQPGRKGFVCRVCGYVYEGETLPPDFICPLCKHGAEAFDPLP